MDIKLPYFFSVVTTIQFYFSLAIPGKKWSLEKSKPFEYLSLFSGEYSLVKITRGSRF